MLDGEPDGRGVITFVVENAAPEGGVDPDAAPRVFDTPAQRQLARRVARKSVVLLKNQGDLLPLDPSLRKLAVIGGKNSAEEAALCCYHAGARVSISYRRDEFRESSVKYWLLPEMKGRLRRGQITGHLGTVPVAIGPDSVTLEPTDGGERFDVPADDVLLLTGYVGDTTLLNAAGVDLEGPDNVPAFDPDTMETNVPGIYVAGTVTAGTQSSFMVFIENCHVHAERIVAHATGCPLPASADPFERPEA